MKKCIVSVLAMFAIVLFVTVPAQASSFDNSLVGVSQSQPLPAFMHGLDAIPMTNSEMDEVRGEGFADVFKWLYNTSAPFRAIWSNYNAWNLFGWELGRMIAYAEGNPDPGPMPSPSIMANIIYWGVDQISN